MKVWFFFLVSIAVLNFCSKNRATILCKTRDIFSLKHNRHISMVFLRIWRWRQSRVPLQLSWGWDTALECYMKVSCTSMTFGVNANNCIGWDAGKRMDSAASELNFNNLKIRSRGLGLAPISSGGNPFPSVNRWHTTAAFTICDEETCVFPAYTQSAKF